MRLKTGVREPPGPSLSSVIEPLEGRDDDHRQTYPMSEVLARQCRS